MSAADQPFALRIAIKEDRPDARVDLREPSMLVHIVKLIGVVDLERLRNEPQEFMVELIPVYPERPNTRLTTRLTIQLSALTYRDIGEKDEIR